MASQEVEYVDHIIQNVRMYQAEEVGVRYCSYIREADIIQYLSSNLKEIRKALCSDLIPADTTVDRCLAMFIRFAVLHDRVSVAVHSPLAARVDQSMLPEEDRDTASIPKRLTIVPPTISGVNRFFIVENEKSRARAWGDLLVPALIIIGVLCACLFPVWPVSARLLIWYAVYFLCLALIFCYIIRLVLFVAVWFAGYEFWFLPNLNHEDKGIIDSFIPLYSWDSFPHTQSMRLIRATAFVLMCLGFYKIQEYTDFIQVQDSTNQFLIDVFEWGRSKVASDDTSIQANEDAEKFMNPVERLNRHWDLCVKHCDFDDYSEFLDYCATDCGCLVNLKESKCTLACEHDVQHDLVVQLEFCDTHGTPREMSGVTSVPPDTVSDVSDEDDDIM